VRLYPLLLGVALVGGCAAKHTSNPGRDASPPEIVPDPVCTWSQAASMPTAGVTSPGATAADLTGPTLQGSPLDMVARKKLPVTGVNMVPALVLGDAYVLRLARTAAAALLMSVKNTGTTSMCFVQASNYHWLAADGTPVKSTTDPRTAYLFGTEGGDEGFSDAACLFPGETGYLADIRPPTAGADVFDSVASIAVDFVGPFAAGQRPLGFLVPTAYDVGDCQGVATFKVVATNQGTADVALTEFDRSLAISLTDDGLPTGMTYLHAKGSAALSPGEPGEVLSSLGTDLGAARRLLVYLDFQGQTFPDAATAALSPAAVRSRDFRSALFARWRSLTTR
jgi:hypothetical protein